MRKEKHEESLKEVMDEIRSALQDRRGLVSHQRRVAMMISIGICELVELYFHRLGIMKEGSRIKHEWFKKSDIKERLENQITGRIGKVKKLDNVIELAKDIEDSRNDLAYGSPSNEELLHEKIKTFLRIKEMVVEETGEINE